MTEKMIDLIKIHFHSPTVCKVDILPRFIEHMAETP
jgi:hypothetical protein